MDSDAYVSCERLDFHSGDTIDRRYVINRSLGEGAFGIVYRVADNDGRIFALKLLKLWTIEASERHKLISRFDMEYETAQIPSDYLVRSHAKGSVGGNPYFVMDCVDGGNLLDAAGQKRIDMARAASQILLGLRDIHSCGKVHRDLKPENVLVSRGGDIRLTDFGISGDRNNRMTARGPLGTPKEMFGTFGYMPPEQINPRRGNATVLPTTDIYSFGVMMYFLLTADMPFGRLESHQDLPQYIENAKHDRWNREALLNADNGQKWLPLIDGCLKPDYTQRLQSADAALSLLPTDIAPPEKPQPVNAIVNGTLLRIMQGEEHGKVYRLNDMIDGVRRIITIGRQSVDTHNTIEIRETLSSFVSRRHCTLEYNADARQWFLRDGQWDRNSASGWQPSLNGTFVNSADATTSGIALHCGDIVSIGDVKLRVEGY